MAVVVRMVKMITVCNCAKVKKSRGKIEEASPRRFV